MIFGVFVTNVNRAIQVALFTLVYLLAFDCLICQTDNLSLKKYNDPFLLHSYAKLPSVKTNDVEYTSFMIDGVLHCVYLFQQKKDVNVYMDYLIDPDKLRILQSHKILVNNSENFISDYNNLTYQNGSYIAYDNESYTVYNSSGNKTYRKVTEFKLSINQDASLTYSQNEFYAIKHGFTESSVKINDIDSNNIIISKIVNKEVLWAKSIPSMIGDVYSTFVKASVDIKNNVIAVIPLGVPEVYLYIESSWDTLSYNFLDSLGNRVAEYTLPSNDDAITCSGQNRANANTIMNTRYRNEKVFFISDKKLLVSYIVPNYGKSYRNYVVFSYNQDAKSWSEDLNYIKILQSALKKDLICIDEIPINLTVSPNPVFDNDYTYVLFRGFSDTPRCKSSKRLRREFLVSGFPSYMYLYKFKFL